MHQYCLLLLLLLAHTLHASPHAHPHPPRRRLLRLRRLRCRILIDDHEIPLPHEIRVTAARRIASIGRGLRHAWVWYRRLAWGRDELRPLEQNGHDPFGGVSVTLVDGLDTLLLYRQLGLSALSRGGQQHSSSSPPAPVQVPYHHRRHATRHGPAEHSWVDDEVDLALAQLLQRTPSICKVNHSVSLFETTIRVLGGLLGAHTQLLSGGAAAAAAAAAADDAANDDDDDDVDNDGKDDDGGGGGLMKGGEGGVEGISAKTRSRRTRTEGVAARLLERAEETARCLQPAFNPEATPRRNGGGRNNDGGYISDAHTHNPPSRSFPLTLPRALYNPRTGLSSHREWTRGASVLADVGSIQVREKRGNEEKRGSHPPGSGCVADVCLYVAIHSVHTLISPLPHPPPPSSLSSPSSPSSSTEPLDDSWGRGI